MNVPELVLLARKDKVEEGSIKGKCMVCGKETDKGLNPPWSANFMGYPYLQDGDCVCPTCYNFFHNQTFRKHSWVASVKDGFKIIHHEDVLNILLNPPEPQFFIYITIGGQKQGWLSALDKVSFSKNRFWVVIEDKSYFVSEEVLQIQKDVIQELRKFKVAKKEFSQGFSVSTMMKLKKKNRLDLLEEAETYFGSPEWEVLTYAV